MVRSLAEAKELIAEIHAKKVEALGVASEALRTLEEISKVLDDHQRMLVGPTVRELIASVQKRVADSFEHGKTITCERKGCGHETSGHCYCLQEPRKPGNGIGSSVEDI